MRAPSGACGLGLVQEERSWRSVRVSARQRGLIGLGIPGHTE